MNYYLISKTDKAFKCKNFFEATVGFSFHQKIAITVYNAEMINYILNKKLTNSLKNIINLYLFYEGEDDGDGCADNLLPRIELLRRVLIESYAFYLSESEIESYLTKFDKLEAKIGNLGQKKSRSM